MSSLRAARKVMERVGSDDWAKRTPIFSIRRLQWGFCVQVQRGSGGRAPQGHGIGLCNLPLIHDNPFSHLASVDVRGILISRKIGANGTPILKPTHTKSASFSRQSIVEIRAKWESDRQADAILRRFQKI